MFAKIGQPTRRIEDERFLIGQGRFVANLVPENAVHAAILRSPHAHARIGAIDTAAARAAPGVLLVLTGEDVAREKLGGLPCRFFPPKCDDAYRPLQPILVRDKVRHAGDRIALVVAETAAQAKDAAELITVDYEPLPALTSLDHALDPSAPKVWDDAPNNLCFHLEHGDRAAIDRIFASCDHVVGDVFHYPRASANAMEPRANLATFDPLQRRYTLYTSAQAPFRQREILAGEIFHLPETALRVISPDVGGAFGAKGAVYPEDALVMWAAGKLKRPVAFVIERSDALLSDQHGRDQKIRAELALAGDGRILAMRASIISNLGAYLSFAAGVPPLGALHNFFSTIYDVQNVYTEVSAVFTNTSPLGPYRGSGRPESIYVIERLVDQAARLLGIDSVTIRRRNLIPSAAMPYRTPGGLVCDNGAFERVLDRALATGEWQDFAARRAASEKSGRLRGIGLAMHCQPSGFLSERMAIRIDEHGSAALHVGTHSTGQGHETMYAQMVSDWLGLPLSEIRVFQGDTDVVLYGRGSFAERSTQTGGSALRLAADDLIAKAKRIVAWMLGVAESEIAFDAGVFRVQASNRFVELREVAQAAYRSMGLPSEIGIGLEGTGVFAGSQTFPNGCFVCEVELDAETGAYTIERLVVAEDVGTVINPLTAAGQMHGSIAQGLGQVLGEEVVYDPTNGQLLSGSFMDYVMPRAGDFPEMETEFLPVPATTNPLGVKGGSEAGNMGAPAALVNALVDALTPFGIRDLKLPATASRIWCAIHEQRKE